MEAVAEMTLTIRTGKNSSHVGMFTHLHLGSPPAADLYFNHVRSWRWVYERYDL